MAMELKGILRGHGDWVTSIAAPEEPTRYDQLLSSSRDQTVLVWDLNRTPEDDQEYGSAATSLTSHSHIVEDVAYSRDAQFALSASWDKSIRLWDLNYNSSVRFEGHEKDVLSVSFSADNRRVVSGSRDKKIKLWNTLGHCKCTVDDAHNDWVSNVQFSPDSRSPYVISAGWDKVIKIWSLDKTFERVGSLIGHTGYINSVAIAPDGSLCASGGKDGIAMLWDLNEQKHLYSLDAGDIIHDLAFSPSKYWLVAGTDAGVRVWDLEKKTPIVDLGPGLDQFPVTEHHLYPACTSVAWSFDGHTLYTGWTDGLIRVWGTNSSHKGY
eukprot:TRINITY_DN9881_c0_g1_i1.p1 TRINITY_DN9881_c0_g1~~TRINITY_DN9881_c0_g1_i1.p1  ORF type:complete len:324 (-),score=84.50 TRINITY_DN9881_c0_g1_i1:82-1053(-)